MKAKPKTVRAVRVNTGIEAAYRKRLDSLISQMVKSVDYWVRAAYKNNTPEIDLAMDALPSQVMNKRLQELTDRWVKRFEDESEKIAKEFVGKTQKYVDTSFQNALKDAGWSVAFKPTRAIKDAMNAAIYENVSLIKSIPSQYMTDVEGIVMRGVTRGRDLSYITDELEKRYGITRRRAVLISRDQSNKMTSVITNARRAELGLYEAVWIHSGAGREPRPSHVKAGRDKLTFDIRVGAEIDGERIFPGEAINCRCSSKTVLPF